MKSTISDKDATRVPPPPTLPCGDKGGELSIISEFLKEWWITLPQKYELIRERSRKEKRHTRI
jgi:hypothetical protein